VTHYADLFELSEDSRIETIGRAASSGQSVGVLLERNEPEKIERYIRKVTERYPGVAVLKRFDGPTPLVVTIQFGRKPQ
jgi:hypothetical protein